MAWSQQDSDAMATLFVEARAKGLWFFCHYQHLWFSPDELEQAHKNEKFRWGAVNWKLLDPQERLAEIDKEINQALQERARFIERIGEKDAGYL